MRSWFLLAALPGCALTPFQDGHADACHDHERVQNNACPGRCTQIEGDAYLDHGRCTYREPEPYELPADADAYDRGFAEGHQDCVVDVYVDTWLAADADSPCASVVDGLGNPVTPGGGS